ncbi:hypothetical protein GCM10011371_02190 [Novosphingobium marinum]|uniref:DUF6692 domain-containing protein n=1 Tax=Novosphingobium marinum TaxID=1514948 RepID=A0A7Y9XSS9_9SPHN|nr:DUF6692 family protein [Novosphingobium marinum]NYH93911.1 hypothetical protein [Novosphingobium marinum]GGC18220.1 hypothetical protein GCM10011371_02190 [Novosphingobium marinum]
MRTVLILAALATALAGCNRNTAIGNDREAQLDPAPKPAPQMPAESALRNVATAIVKPETMSAADVNALGGLDGKCTIRLTEIAFPSLLYEPGRSAAIKLNAKLIPLQAAGENRYESGGLVVTLRPLEPASDDDALRRTEMIVVPPAAEDEIGYRGFSKCYLAGGGGPTP